MHAHYVIALCLVQLTALLDPARQQWKNMGLTAHKFYVKAAEALNLLSTYINSRHTYIYLY